MKEFRYKHLPMSLRLLVTKSCKLPALLRRTLKQWQERILQNRLVPPEIRHILLLFFATRLLLTMLGVGAHVSLPLGYGKQVFWSSHVWLDVWGVWDSAWYMDIIQNGYSMLPRVAAFPNQHNFAFFPLYPLLTKMLSVVIGGRDYLAGLLLSNGCLLASACLLYRLVALDFSLSIARRAVKYLFLFPVGFMLSGLQTESLFLCLSLLSFYAARRQKWAIAGCAGMLLSATRPTGLLIVLPLMVEYWQRPRPTTETVRLHGQEAASKTIRLDVLWLLLIPVGLLGFCVFNYIETGDFFYFKSVQSAWNRAFGNPFVVLWEGLKVGVSEPSFKKLLEVSFCGAALAGLTAFYRRIGLAYWLLGMYSLLVPLSSGIASQPRFTVVVFPLFIVLALMSQRRWWDWVLSAFLGLLQGVLMVFWSTGHGLVI